MRRTLSSCLYLTCIALVVSACAKEASNAPTNTGTPPVESAAAPEADEAEAKKKVEGETKSEPEATGASKASIDTKTEVAKTPGNAVDDAQKTKLAEVYKEIYCAQRKGESERLLEIYTKNGFDDPETWTKVWTKAAEDGAWVAQTTHEAIRACGDQSPPSVEGSDSK